VRAPELGDPPEHGRVVFQLRRSSPRKPP
jgi:hypothetical protein